MKKLLILALLVMGLLVPVFAKGSKEKEMASDPDALKIVALINGLLGDKSFFDSCANGITMIKDEYGSKVKTKLIEMSYDETKWEPTLLDVVEQDWDIIIVATWQMVEMLQMVAPDYPDKKFIIYDTSVDYKLGLDNVYSILYAQNESSFVAGVLAAAVTASDMPMANKDPVIGFLGGMDIPVINDFLVGYIQGAQSVNPSIKVAISYIGSFNDSAKGKEMALAQYNLGVDIGYNVAGQAGLGQIDAAKDVNRYAIGVDSDQSALFQDNDPAKANLIVTSILKRVDMSLLRAVKLHMEGTLPYGQAETLGFAEGAVGLVRNDNYDKMVPKDIKMQVADIEKQIHDGKLKVDSAFGMSSEDLNTLKNSVKP